VPVAEGREQGPRRLGWLPEAPVPAVPPSTGARAVVLLSVGLAILGVVFLGLTATAAADVGATLGVAPRADATVLLKVQRQVGPASGGCSAIDDFAVSLDGRLGFFSVCDTDQPVAGLAPGDGVRVASVPWSSDVVALDADRQRVWPLVALAGGLVLLVVGLTWARRYRRLLRGSATGMSLTGRVAGHTRNALAVRTDGPGARSLGLLALRPTTGLVDAEPVEVWSTRRSVLTRAPRGPWVVRGATGPAVYSHARVRRGS
jgi:hypothetical protein